MANTKPVEMDCDIDELRERYEEAEARLHKLARGFHLRGQTGIDRGALGRAALEKRLLKLEIDKIESSTSVNKKLERMTGRRSL